MSNATGSAVPPPTPTILCFFHEGTAYYSVLVIIAFLIVCINSGVIYTMATNAHLRTKRNAFLASLTLSDLLAGLVAIPLHILCNCYHRTQGVLCLAQAICFRFIAISTMLNIFMITVERYLGIIYPIKYTIILTKLRTFILLSCTWATSLSSALVTYSWLVTSNAGNADAPEWEKKLERGYFIFSFVAFFFLPLIIMIVLYVRMFRAISKASRSPSKARMYLKSVVVEEPQSPAARRPAENADRRSRSYTYSYSSCGTRPERRELISQVPVRKTSVECQNRGCSHVPCVDLLAKQGERRFQSLTPATPVERRKRAFSHGSYGDHPTTQERALLRPQSPAPLSPMVGRHRTFSHSSYGDHPLALEPLLSLSPTARSPMVTRDRTLSHGSYGDYLAIHDCGRLGSNQRTRSRNMLSSSDISYRASSHQSGVLHRSETRDIFDNDNTSCCKKQDGSRVSVIRRLSRACETAASRLRMIRRGSHEDRVRHARVAGEHRVLIIFVTMLGVFVFCWLSWYVMLFDFTHMFHIPVVVLDCFDVLRFSVSFFNPLLYTFLKKDFRNAFVRSCRGRKDRQKRKSGK